MHLISVCFLSLALQGFLQDKDDEVLTPKQETPRFLVSAYAALHEVRVTDRTGKPVLGLKRGDFIVKEDGQEREIIFGQENRNVAVTLGVLLDTGSAMSEKQIRTGKNLIFDLIHKLDSKDEILLATYDDEVHFLSPLTSDRLKLLESIRNISLGGRPRLWSRLGTLFASSANTGWAVDKTLLNLRRTKHPDRIILVISAAFGNIGKATQDHLQSAGVRFFAIRMRNSLGDIFNLGGDQTARKRIVEETGGISFDGDKILERIQLIHDSLKHYYLLAYDPADIEKPFSERKIQFLVSSHPYYRVHAVRRVDTSDSIFSPISGPSTQ